MPLVGGEESPGTFRPIKVDSSGRVYAILDDQLGLFQKDSGGNLKVNAGIVYSTPSEPSTITLTESSPTDSYTLAVPENPTRVIIVGSGDDEVFQMNFDNQTNYATLPTLTTYVFDLTDVTQINFQMVNLPVTISVIEFTPQVVR